MDEQEGEAAGFWHLVRSGTPPPDGSDAEQLLAIHDAINGFRITEAEDGLAALAPRALSPALASIASLLRAQLDLRRGSPDDLARADAALAELTARSEIAASTLGRAWHSWGVLAIRRDVHGEALERLLIALAALEDGDPLVMHVLDGVGQALAGQGAWVEARRTFRAVIARKEAAGDSIGAAISAGNLALVELDLGRGAEVRPVLERALAGIRDEAVLSQLRLATMVLQCAHDCGEDVEAPAAEVTRLLVAAGDRPHYLKAFAGMALASAASDPAEVRALLHAARQDSGGGEVGRFVSVLEGRLTPGFEPDAAWKTEVLGDEETPDSRSGLDVLLLLAEHAWSRGRQDESVGYLDEALEMASRVNNRVWLARIDATFERIAPRLLAQRVSERFSGRTADQLGETVKEDVTIIFADLVGFTKRSTHLAPLEVMATVRSLFELCVPLLTEHRVRPLQYLGDGLLAVAQGPGHSRRAVEFSLDLVRRTSRASRLRYALGEELGLELRAGVASGPVVLGLLGSHYKLEYLAIGRTTNLAARLQAKAEPEEVVTLPEVAAGAGVDGDHEFVPLKGFAEPVEIVRIRVVD